MQPAPEDVLTLSQTLDKLLARDSVQVELIPEKKGLFLKHVEYQLTSQVRGPSTRSPRRHRIALFRDLFCTFATYPLSFTSVFFERNCIMTIQVLNHATFPTVNLMFCALARLLIIFC